MDAGLVAYSSDESDTEQHLTGQAVSLAPEVSVAPLMAVLDPNADSLARAIPIQQMYAPVAGPTFASGIKKKVTGHAELYAMDHAAFEAARLATVAPQSLKRRRKRKKRRLAPSVKPQSDSESDSDEEVQLLHKDKFGTLSDAELEESEPEVVEAEEEEEEDSEDEEERERQRMENARDVQIRHDAHRYRHGGDVALDDLESEDQTLARLRHQRAIETSQWVSSSPATDYLGRGVMHVPSEWRPPARNAFEVAQEAREAAKELRKHESDEDSEDESDEELAGFNSIPKRHFATLRGHDKAVAAVQWLPQSGHLLLSAGMGGLVKLWSAGGTDSRRKPSLLRDYAGHEKAVRAIDFSSDGRHFLTVSYDYYTKLWDTETGQVVSRHTTGVTPLCAKFHPLRGKDEFLCGQRNRRIVQWDTRAPPPPEHLDPNSDLAKLKTQGGKVAQVYEEHLDAVNSICFIDGGRRFVSVGDDKKIIVWEYGAPVPVKHMLEPWMHASSWVTRTPSDQHFLVQSQNNKILTWGSTNKFRMESKKKFSGHQNAGFAIQCDVSPDGRFVSSGSSDGRMFFWDWNSGRRQRMMKCHEGACVGVTWHPHRPSLVATCGWDGLVKLWQ